MACAPVAWATAANTSRGHGFVKTDSHLLFPVDRRSLKAILADDAAPYGWLSASLDAVMRRM